MSLSHSPSIVTTGLQIYFDAANPRSYPGTGATWFDLMKNYDATLTSYTWDAGGWFTFSAAGQAITAATTGFTSAISIEVVYKGTGATTSVYGRIFDRGDTTLSMGTYLTYRLRAWVYGGGARSGERVVDGIGNDGLWHHAVMTYDGANFKFYVDGVQISTNLAKTGNLEDNRAITIGNGDANIFEDPIAFCRVYDIALTQAQVTQNFEATRGRFGI